MSDKEFTPITDDMSLDDIGDVPSFEKWPTGAYLVDLEDGIVKKDINDVEYKSCTFTLVGEGQEVKVHGDQVAPKSGDTMEMLFNMGNAYGAANYKKLAAPIKQATGATTIREIDENSKGMRLLIVLKSKFNKKKSEETGNDIYNHDITMAALGT